MPDRTPTPNAPVPLYEFLYWSQLADSQSPTAIGQILARARPFNAANGITGLLVFDGQRFCQHLEGPAVALESLMPTRTHAAIFATRQLNKGKAISFTCQN